MIIILHSCIWKISHNSSISFSQLNHLSKGKSLNNFPTKVQPPEMSNKISLPFIASSSSAKQISSISNFKCVRNYYCDDYYSVYIIAKPLKTLLLVTWLGKAGSRLNLNFYSRLFKLFIESFLNFHVRPHVN